MAATSLPLIDHATIRGAVDPGSYARGQEYHRLRRVTRLEWDPDERRLVGAVRGSHPKPYATSVWLSEVASGSEVTDSSCSCPIGGHCKHVVASLLAYHERAVAQPLPDLPKPPTRAPANQSHAKRSTAPPTSPPRPAAPPVPAWKTALGALTRGGGGPQSSIPLARTYPPLGLQFRVDGLKQATEAGPRSLVIPIRLQVRPVQQGANGGWSGGYGVGWSPGHYGRSPFDPQVTEWVSELGSLWTSRTGYGYNAPEWRALEDFTSSALWLLLAEGARLGVPLLGSAARDTVALASRADLALAATADGEGGIQLRRHLAFDDVAAGYDVIGAVGKSGLFAVRSIGKARHLDLGPTARRLSEDDRALTGFRDATVPKAEVTDFLESAYLTLRRRVHLRCFDGSVTLPEPAPPRLVLMITSPQPSTLQLGWEWAYGTARCRLHPTSEAFRDPEAETAIWQGVEKTLGARFLSQEPTELSGPAAVRFAQDLLPLLEASEEVVVEATELPSYREIEDTPLITVGASESEDPDWFDLAIRVSVEGREVPFAPLFAAVARGEEYLVLDDGSYLRTDVAALDRLRELIEEARRLEDRPGPLRLNRYAASLWGDFEELADVVEQADRWRESVGALAALARDGAAPVPEDVPETVTAELRPYQKEAFDWLAFLHRHSLGGILADDMGLGKTIEVLTLLEHVRSTRPDERGAPFLVVAPASVTGNWAAEAQRFTPDLDVVVLPSTLGRLGVPIEQIVGEVDVVVISYAIFRLDFEQFATVEWAGLILDEAQFLKNPKTRVHECARLLKAPFKLAVTGTPMENNLMELWAMLAVVAPGLYGSATRFREDYVKTVADGLRSRQSIRQADAGHLVSYSDEDRQADLGATASGEAALARLRRRIRPILLRRTKEQVAPDLPERIHQELRVELAPKHRRAYDLLLQRERQRVLRLLDEDYEGNRFTIFRSLTLLRRAAIDISLTDPERYAGVPSAKLELLFEKLADVTGAGHRALVFSQFTSFLRKVAERADHEGIGYEYLDGATRRRAAVVERFKTGDAPLFLISLKAGGFGLNLTEADYVFMLDPWWNPATENQAIDRTHRIGQTRNVMVHRLVSANTIEEKVMALKTRKAQLFDAVLGDDEGTFSGSLGPDDIRGLFEATEAGRAS
ncbi:SNF2-related protein [uncultured Friedmanniella sp.]|uniref:DEAD/DEAH box helicase n=1 Tax=uncultured Friedmanniella sp. TaxID=335381 RepID=UPI0035CA5B36